MGAHTSHCTGNFVQLFFILQVYKPQTALTLFTRGTFCTTNRASMIPIVLFCWPNVLCWLGSASSDNITGGRRMALTPKTGKYG